MSDWQPSPRYPDHAIQEVDGSFARLRLALAKVARLATGTRWAEGPVWFGDARCLLWSDVPGSCMLRWDEETGAVSAFRKPSGHANGDVVCKSDGSVWFTDPSFGILGYYEGAKAEPGTYVYRSHGGALEVVAEGILQPNGLAFSPDESLLYTVESRSVPRKILANDVVEGRRLANRGVLIDAGPGTPDGFRCDTEGNLWCGWGMGQAGLDGVHVFNPEGRLIGRIDLPERCANVCFGGVHRNRLFMAASTSLYALYVNVQGVGYF